jgi:hypothetical protein
MQDTIRALQILPCLNNEFAVECVEVHVFPQTCCEQPCSEDRFFRS